MLDLNHKAYRQCFILSPIHTADSDATQLSSWVVSAVCTRPSAVVTQFTMQPMWLAQKIGNWVTTDDWCVHTADTTQLDFVVGKFFRLVETRRDCRQLVANSMHTADATQLASASAVCIGLKKNTNFCTYTSATDLGAFNALWSDLAYSIQIHVRATQTIDTWLVFNWAKWIFLTKWSMTTRRLLLMMQCGTINRGAYKHADNASARPLAEPHVTTIHSSVHLTENYDTQARRFVHAVGF